MEDERVVAHPETGRHSQMHARRFELADAVHARAVSCETTARPLDQRCPAREIVMHVGDPLGEPKDAAVDAKPVAGAHMMRLGLDRSSRATFAWAAEK